MDVLTNLIVVIIPQYIHVMNHHTNILTLTQCYVSYISIKMENNKNKKQTVTLQVRTNRIEESAMIWGYFYWQLVNK